MKKIVVMGAGGLGTEAMWVLEDINSINEEWAILGFVDDNPMVYNGEAYGYQILGTPEEMSSDNIIDEIWYYCAIGNNHTREMVTNRLASLGWRAATLIHPSVIIARHARIGQGVYIGACSVVCPNASIGDHVIVNTRVSIGHDAVLEDFSQVSPGAQINGFCKVGRGANIGSNASLYPGVSIGERAVVGGNSLCVRKVRSDATVIGVPALEIKYTPKE
ncbi:MAG: acetyltransferase [Bacillota bacterium]